MKKLLHTYSILLLAFSFNAHALTGYLENPAAGSTQSGIGVVSGWHCTAQTISVSIDDLDFGQAGAGTNRFDTESVCGHPRTGFSRLISWSALAEGSHTISVYADGALIETRNFNTIRSGGQPFASGLSANYTLSGFPAPDQFATLTWREAKQSFVVTRIESSPVSRPPFEQLNPVLVAAGDLNAGKRAWGELPILLTSALDFALVRPGIVASLPPAYPSPDFTRTHLFYFEAPGDWDLNSYIRVEKTDSNPDGTQHVVTVEYCGIPEAGVPFHRAFSMYSVPAITGSVRFELVQRDPPACQTDK